jgi:hypothetical protein
MIEHLEAAAPYERWILLLATAPYRDETPLRKWHNSAITYLRNRVREIGTYYLKYMCPPPREDGEGYTNILSIQFRRSKLQLSYPRRARPASMPSCPAATTHRS